MEKKRYQTAVRARATYEFLTCFVVWCQGTRQLAMRMVRWQVGVGTNAAACQSSEDDRGGRVLILQAGEMLLVRRSLFLWMCWIFVEDDLDKICAAKMSFPRNY